MAERLGPGAGRPRTEKEAATMSDQDPKTHQAATNQAQSDANAGRLPANTTLWDQRTRETYTQVYDSTKSNKSS